MNKYYTDYPFTELGDIPYTKAPIRELSVISYDRNKYCIININGIELEVKAGYIYIAPGRCGTVKTISKKELKNYES